MGVDGSIVGRWDKSATGDTCQTTQPTHQICRSPSPSSISTRQHRGPPNIAPLAHEVVQPHRRRRRQQPPRELQVLLRPRLADLLVVGLEGAQRGDERLVRQPVDVLGVVVGLVGALGLLLGLAGVDALEDAEAPGVRGLWVGGSVVCWSGGRAGGRRRELQRWLCACAAWLCGYSQSIGRGCTNDRGQEPGGGGGGKGQSGGGPAGGRERRQAHLNSDSLSCSFLTACVRVRYCAALPFVPCVCGEEGEA